VQQALLLARTQTPSWIERAERGEKVEGDWKSQIRPLFAKEQGS
jgi:hypothetical protein